MKSKEFHRYIQKNGWKVIRIKGTSHYIYEKNGIRVPVPYHGAKEMPEGLRKSIIKQMGLK